MRAERSSIQRHIPWVHRPASVTGFLDSPRRVRECLDFRVEFVGVWIPLDSWIPDEFVGVWIPDEFVGVWIP